MSIWDEQRPGPGTSWLAQDVLTMAQACYWEAVSGDFVRVSGGEAAWREWVESALRYELQEALALLRPLVDEAQS